MYRSVLLFHELVATGWSEMYRSSVLVAPGLSCSSSQGWSEMYRLVRGSSMSWLPRDGQNV